MGKETVLADSGREGEIAAGVGRVRSLAFSNICALFFCCAIRVGN